MRAAAILLASLSLVVLTVGYLGADTRPRPEKLVNSQGGATKSTRRLAPKLIGPHHLSPNHKNFDVPGVTVYRPVRPVLLPPAIPGNGGCCGNNLFFGNPDGGVATCSDNGSTVSGVSPSGAGINPNNVSVTANYQINLKGGTEGALSYQVELDVFEGTGNTTQWALYTANYGVTCGLTGLKINNDGFTIPQLNGGTKYSVYSYIRVWNQNTGKYVQINSGNSTFTTTGTTLSEKSNPGLDQGGNLQFSPGTSTGGPAYITQTATVTVNVSQSNNNTDAEMIEFGMTTASKTLFCLSIFQQNTQSKPRWSLGCNCQGASGTQYPWTAASWTKSMFGGWSFDTSIPLNPNNGNGNCTYTIE